MKPGNATGRSAHKSSPCALVLLAIVEIFALSARAQDALRSSMAGEEIARGRARDLQEKFYNLKLGPVQFTFDVGANVAWTDNVFASDENAQSDWSIGPRAGARGTWPISPNNTLLFGVGVAYHKFIDHSELDRLTITPDSAISFDIFVKDFRFNLHERASYSLDPIDVGSVSGTGEYGGLHNTAGLSVDWDLNKVIVTAGYDHYNFISDAGASDNETRASELFNTKAAFAVNPALKAGPEASFGITDYDGDFHNDNQNMSAGLFADWKASDHLSVRPRAGYVYYNFDSGGMVGDTPDLSSYYVDLSIAHTVNQFFTHSISAGHDVQSGVNSDALRQYYARYLARWDLIRNLGTTASVFYENGSDSDSATGEDFTRLGFGVSLGYRITRNLSANLSYQFMTKDSSRIARDYTHNTVSLSLSYRFLPRLQ